MPEMFANVILPLSLHDSFTYSVPTKFQQKIAPGKRVIVQFGSKRLYSALVISLTNKYNGEFKIKPILQVLDEKPVVLQKNLELWSWMAAYYCCTLGDILRAALPSGLKLESKSNVYLSGIKNEIVLSDKEQLILDELKKGGSTLENLQKNIGPGFSYPAIQMLLDKKQIVVEEKVKTRYTPKTATFVKPGPELKTEGSYKKAIESLERAKKQKALLIHFAEKCKLHQPGQHAIMSKSTLFEGTSFNHQQLKELAKKHMVELTTETVSRIDKTFDGQVTINLLNPHQEKALNEIKTAFQEKNTVLLHGVTASGKTEIYIHLIDEAIKKGKQALYLVPEIALTTQIVERLINSFGEKVGIYHSRLNNQERVEIWEKVLKFQSNPKNGYQVILGARSAIFLPFWNLGLVIVDEEHENSFKQFDPAPRYHARDTAVVLGIQNSAKTLLGSATPSFESFFNTKNTKYGYVKLIKRHSQVELPEIVVADLKKAYNKKQMHSVLAPELFDLTENALHNNQQVILFQNRRGYSPFIQCFNCSWIPKCQNCDVSLTYHKFKKRLNCHYCGYNEPYPGTCPDCASPEIKSRGFGTEKIEDDLKQLFKNARIARMDLDSTRGKNAFAKIVTNVENRKTDILVGTQMVTKGLDFGHVSTVGILNADNLLNFPDFRAHERTYQLISQVSGRAGRKQKQGRVVIQTTDPGHPVIDFIKSQDYELFFNTLMEERNLFKYPPYYRLIKLVVKHKNPETVNRAANQLSNRVKQSNQLVVLGPEFPLVSRIQQWYQKEIWVKFSKKLDQAKVKTFVTHTVSAVKQLAENSSCIINIDVDPA